MKVWATWMIGLGTGVTGTMLELSSIERMIFGGISFLIVLAMWRKDLE